ncbi:hypothetical protein M5K25_027068 [Dendrobium thyrsiflorum]|uniref:MULE transposase domain-containing protein n=1 Tax=Dendrobium thyrsiflorum TaxID=117978 RepID=A0ABD0TZ18_DENTH
MLLLSEKLNLSNWLLFTCISERRRNFCQAVAGTSEIPSGNLDDGYETMSSGSTDPCPDDDDDESNSNFDEANVDMNNEIHSIVQRYCYTNIGTAEGIDVNNEFVKTYSTTREWDEDVANDSEYVGNQVEQEFSIPIELREGMCFSNKEDLKFALQGWSIINNVEYVVVSSNRKKMTVVCAQNGRSGIPCIWRLHAGVSKLLGGIWKISSMKNQHTCATPILATGHRQCNSQFISYFILPSIRRHMDLKPREIIGQIEAKFNIKVSYMKAWDARRKAVKIVFGSWEESYRTINLFMDAIVSSMPDTVYKIQTSENHRFERMFFSFGPSINGWNYCRPVLCLDGTFLLGKYRGTLLTAVGIDANNGLYPLAFAIVESECVDSWACWFRSWATLYMLKAPVEAPTIYYPRSPTERHMREFIVDLERRFQPYFGGSEDSPLQG